MTTMIEERTQLDNGFRVIETCVDEWTHDYQALVDNIIRESSVEDAVEYINIVRNKFSYQLEEIHDVRDVLCGYMDSAIERLISKINHLDICLTKSHRALVE